MDVLQRRRPGNLLGFYSSHQIWFITFVGHRLLGSLDGHFSILNEPPIGRSPAR